jgi:hypothetical protein
VEGTLLAARGQGGTYPHFLSVLAERFDPEVIDLPEGSARIRLAVAGGGEWDALVSESGLRLTEADGSRPDALLTAEEAAWARIVRDVRGGMEAFRAGELRVRRNLHLGVGFLAATFLAAVVGLLRLNLASVRRRR